MTEDTPLFKLPDDCFNFGGYIDDMCREVGYIESGRVVVNNLNLWNVTIREFKKIIEYEH